MSFLFMIPISILQLTLFTPSPLQGLSLPEILEHAASSGALDYGWGFYLTLLTGHLLLYLLVGTVLAGGQYKVLAFIIPNRIQWTFLTVLGLELILLGDLLYTGLSTGGVPGPFEPLLIGLGGGSLMAIMQYLYLRSLGIKKGKWVGLWILGILTGIVSSFACIFIYEYFFIDPIKKSVSPLAFVVMDWLSFILPYFTLIGFFAGLFSAKPLFAAITNQQNADNK